MQEHNFPAGPLPIRFGSSYRLYQLNNDICLNPKVAELQKM